MVAGAATTAAAAVILGEYELEGLTPIVAGVLLGLIVAEVVTVVGRHRDVPAAGTSAVLAAGGVAWGAWLSTGPDEDWSFVPDLAWVGVAIAAVAALLWVRTPGRRGAGSRRSP